MERNWRSWVPRLILLAAGLLYVTIGTKFALQPDSAGAESGYRFAEAVARTNLRAGVGGFPLGLGAALLFCAAAPARVEAGLKLAALVTGVVLVIRFAGAASDGVLTASARLLGPETLVTVLTGTTAALLARSRRPAEAT
jgi:hypothetical protein